MNYLSKQKLLFFPILIGCFLILAQLNMLPRLHGFLHDIPKMDKIAHFGAFTTLSFCLFSYFKTRRKRLLFLLILLSVFDEGIQYGLEYRSFDLWDLFCDISGILFGLFLTTHYPKKIYFCSLYFKELLK